MDARLVEKLEGWVCGRLSGASPEAVGGRRGEVVHSLGAVGGWERIGKKRNPLQRGELCTFGIRTALGMVSLYRLVSAGSSCSEGPRLFARFFWFPVPHVRKSFNGCWCQGDSEHFTDFHNGEPSAPCSQVDGLVVTLPNARTYPATRLLEWLETAAQSNLELRSLPSLLHPADASWGSVEERSLTLLVAHEVGVSHGASEKRGGQLLCVHQTRAKVRGPDSPRLLTAKGECQVWCGARDAVQHEASRWLGATRHLGRGQRQSTERVEGVVLHFEACIHAIPCRRAVMFL